MQVQDANGRPVRVDDIVKMPDGRLLQVKGWAKVSDPSLRGVHIDASQVEVVKCATEIPEMASQVPGEMTILWGLEPPPPPPPE